ncbi:uncharacterized protein LOC119601105 [Lucilia sericata]|uniref:uncharacterized protein LOC119601105 n=1 Tax=Lucilia sericata TaxID=13632 RepID=UPI0018A868C1|nr:uncharacterized protein LOC119601105 [Lucilia sericata]
MKTVLFLSLLALAFINVLTTNDICRYCPDCPLDDPECGNNRPMNCTGIDPNLKIRNHWQPDLYWICVEPNRPAEARRCGNDLFFQEELGECVFRFDYKYSCPCHKCGCLNETTVAPV